MFKVSASFSALVCRVHQRLIQSGFSHVFGVYSEPIEIARRLHLSFYLSQYPIRDKSLYRRYNSKWKYSLQSVSCDAVCKILHDFLHLVQRLLGLASKAHFSAVPQKKNPLGGFMSGLLTDLKNSRRLEMMRFWKLSGRYHR